MPWRDRFDWLVEVLAPRAALRRRQTRAAAEALHQDRLLASRRTPLPAAAEDWIPERRRQNWVPPRRGSERGLIAAIWNSCLERNGCDDPHPLRQETSDQQFSCSGRAATPAQRLRSIRSPPQPMDLWDERRQRLISRREMHTVRSVTGCRMKPPEIGLPFPSSPQDRRSNASASVVGKACNAPS